MKMIILPFLVNLVAAAAKTKPSPSIAFRPNQTYLPVVMMHGMNSSAEELKGRAETIEAAYPGIYVHRLAVYDGKKSLMGQSLEKQVDAIHDAVKDDPNLKYGFNMHGESQGAVLSRAYIEKYNDPPVHRFVSISGPHAGVDGCGSKWARWGGRFCYSAVPWIVMRFWPVTFAQLYKNAALGMEKWARQSPWMSTLNNDLSVNQKGKDNMLALNQYVVARTRTDEMVTPSESAYHQFWEWGKPMGPGRSEVVALTKDPSYVNDVLGLKTLNEHNRMQFLEYEGQHTRYTDDWLKAQVIPFYNCTYEIENEIPVITCVDSWTASPYGGVKP